LLILQFTLAITAFGREIINFYKKLAVIRAYGEASYYTKNKIFSFVEV
jgi:hypothetical protein